MKLRLLFVERKPYPLFALTEMDERHWWITCKVQESFQIGGSTNPSQLESFMTAADSLELVNSFFSPRGDNKLFFYLTPLSSGESLYTLDHLGISTEIYDVINENASKVMYFIRAEPAKPVSVQGVEREVMTGELKQHLLQQFSSLVSHVFLPLVRVQQQWGFATGDTQRTLAAGLEKLAADLKDVSEGAVPPAKQYILQQPTDALCGNRFLIFADDFIF